MLACNFAEYSPTLRLFFTGRLSNKHFLIWLLTTPPHIKYVATLPCNFVVNRLFCDIKVSQVVWTGETYAGSGWIFNKQFTANSPGNLPVKKIVIMTKI